MVKTITTNDITLEKLNDVTLTSDEVLSARGSNVSLSERFTGIDDQIGIMNKKKVFVEQFSNLKVAITGGYDWLPAFNAAIESLGSNGGTVIFNDEYLCSDWLYVNWKDNVQLIGTPKSKITFTKYSPSSPMGIAFANCKNVVVEGLTLTSPTDAGGYQFTDANKKSGAVTAEQANSAIIHLNSVTNFRIENVHLPFHNGFGIVVSKSKKGYIKNNVFENTWRDSVHIQDGCEFIHVHGNTVENPGDDGLSVFSAGYEGDTAWSAATAYVVGNRVNSNGNVYECTVAGTSGSTAPSHTTGTATDGTVTWQYKGVYTLISKNIQFSFNTIKNSYNRGLYVLGENIRVVNNIIDGTAKGGIYSESEQDSGKAKVGRKLIIKNNTIRNIGTVDSPFRTSADLFRGIFIQNQNTASGASKVADVVIVDNEIYDLMDSPLKNFRGIQVFQVKNCVIRGNTINDYDYEGINANLSDNVAIKNNKIISPLCDDDSRGIYVEQTTNLKIKGNEIDGGVSTGINVYNSTDVLVSRNDIYDINPRSLDAKNGITCSTINGLKVLNNSVQKFGKLERSIKLATISGYLAIKGNVFPHKDFGNYQFSDAHTSLSTNVTGTTQIYDYDLEVTAMPTAGTWRRGQVLTQTLPSESGTAGSMYTTMGYVCILGGNPGTWKEQRALTGN